MLDSKTVDTISLYPINRLETFYNDNADLGIAHYSLQVY